MAFDDVAPTLCTCGPWNGVIPPPPCPVHAGGFRTTPPVPPEWVSTPTKTPFFTEEMIRRAMGQEPCDMDDTPFCGWDDCRTKEDRDG